jgi:hypothetical protein
MNHFWLKDSTYQKQDIDSVGAQEAGMISPERRGKCHESRQCTLNSMTMKLDRHPTLQKKELYNDFQIFLFKLKLIGKWLLFCLFTNIF